MMVVFRVVSAIFHAHHTPHKRRKCGVSRKNCCLVSLLQIAPCTFFRLQFYVLRSKHPLSSAKWDTIQFSHALGNCRVLSFLSLPLDIIWTKFFKKSAKLQCCDIHIFKNDTYFCLSGLGKGKKLLFIMRGFLKIFMYQTHLLFYVLVKITSLVHDIDNLIF